MNETIIFSQLGKTIAELTQCTEADAEAFLRELFALASETLDSEGEVIIPALGRFVVTSETVAFVPDSELAEAVNAPFAAFEPVELPADMDIDENEPQTDTPEEEVAVTEEPVAEPEPEPEPVVVPEEPIENEPESEEEPIEPSVDENVPDESEPEEGKQRSKAWIGWLFACLICFGCGWVTGRYVPIGSAALSDEPLAVDSVAVVDTVAAIDSVEVDTVVEPLPIVTDTINATRYLTTMARAHYGQMEYWVYIYEENADALGHPDRLNAGTVVVIPPAEKYGLIAGDSEKIREANAKSIEIYARFN